MCFPSLKLPYPRIPPRGEKVRRFDSCLKLLFLLPCCYIICRIEAFEVILGQQLLANHVDQMSIDEVEQIDNNLSSEDEEDATNATNGDDNTDATYNDEFDDY